MSHTFELKLQHAKFTCDGHTFHVFPTDEFGMHTGRRRYRIECSTCGVTVHEATTSWGAMVDMHLRGSAP